MHNLKSSFGRYFNITSPVLKIGINSPSNFLPYADKLKIAGCQIITFTIVYQHLKTNIKYCSQVKFKNSHHNNLAKIVSAALLRLISSKNSKLIYYLTYALTN